MGWSSVGGGAQGRVHKGYRMYTPIMASICKRVTRFLTNERPIDLHENPFVESKFTNGLYYYGENESLFLGKSLAREGPKCTKTIIKAISNSFTTWDFARIAITLFGYVVPLLFCLSSKL